MIINASYFTLPPLSIPNAVELPNNSGRTYAPKTGVQAYIDRYEAELLINALGQEQYEELLDQFEEGVLKPDAEQKWVDLVNGRDDWKGLRYQIGTYKISLIANYVFYQYLSNTELFYAVTGLTRPDVANAISISANVTLVTQWNDFVRLYQGSRCTTASSIIYPINGYPYYDGINTIGESLLGFLSKYPELYSTEFFKVYEFKNRHGL